LNSARQRAEATVGIQQTGWPRGGAAKIDSLRIELNHPSASLTVNDLFFNPLDPLFPDLKNRHPGPASFAPLRTFPAGAGFFRNTALA
jgi:hypothetical protein